MSSCIVGDLMKHSPLCVYEDDNLFTVVEYMNKHNVDAISVVNKDFSLLSQVTKKQIKKYLNTNFFIFGSLINSLKNIKVRNIIKRNELPLTFYPTTRADDALCLMKHLNNKYAPVVETPWEKKVVGFIWLSDKCN